MSVKDCVATACAAKDKALEYAQGVLEYQDITSVSGLTEIAPSDTSLLFHVSSLGENTTVANPSSLPAAGKIWSGLIVIVQDGVGGRTINWDTSYVSAWDWVEDLSPGTKNEYAFLIYPDGSVTLTWRGSF